VNSIGRFRPTDPAFVDDSSATRRSTKDILAVCNRLRPGDRGGLLPGSDWNWAAQFPVVPGGVLTENDFEVVTV